MAMEAEIVFCPYSYIVDPIIREAVEADIKGSIIIFDEAQYVDISPIKQPGIIASLVILGVGGNAMSHDLFFSSLHNLSSRIYGID